MSAETPGFAGLPYSQQNFAGDPVTAVTPGQAAYEAKHLSAAGRYDGEYDYVPWEQLDEADIGERRSDWDIAAEEGAEAYAVIAAQQPQPAPATARPPIDVHVVSDQDALYLVCLTEDRSDTECSKILAEIEPGSTWHELAADIAAHAADHPATVTQEPQPAPGDRELEWALASLAADRNQLRIALSRIAMGQERDPSVAADKALVASRENARREPALGAMEPQSAPELAAVNAEHAEFLEEVLINANDEPHIGEADEDFAIRYVRDLERQVGELTALIAEGEPLTVRELLDEIGVMAANAPEDGDSFGLLEEIAMRIAAVDVPDTTPPAAAAPELAAAIKDIIDRYPEQQPAPDLEAAFASGMRVRTAPCTADAHDSEHFQVRTNGHWLCGHLLASVLAAQGIAAGPEPQPAPDLAAAADVRPREGEPGWHDVTCGSCGSEFGMNFQLDQIDCVECDARRCPHCRHWFGAYTP